MKLPVALVQLDATGDVAANVARAADLAAEAAAGGARLVALPEYLQYRGGDDGYRASARPIPGDHTAPFAAVAQRHGAWVLVGSLAETSADPDRPYNTSVLIRPDGTIAATYRKIHLFDVAVDDGPVDAESARVTAGAETVVADVDGVAVGLSICYDIRFPELYRTLALAGAQVLTVPANFMERTGRDHWEVLLRARAIENGAWVIAPVADRRSTRLPGLRTLDGHRSVGHDRRPGTRRRLDRSRRARHRSRRGRAAPDPVARESPAGHVRVQLHRTGGAAQVGPTGGWRPSPYGRRLTP